MGQDDLPNEDEPVGYRKPPRSGQFKPGQSGNPKGRPKGPGSLHKLIAKQAAKKVTVKENGVEKKMTKLDLVIAAMFSRASKGEVAAARLLTSLVLASGQLAGDDYESGYSDADLKTILAEADWQAKLVALRQEEADGSS
jgi:hypothetical protein